LTNVADDPDSVSPMVAGPLPVEEADAEGPHALVSRAILSW
jgi:hypothetical protein